VAGPCITRIQVRTSHVPVSHGALVGISAALAQDLVNFCFIGPTSDFIGTGLSIFMVSYPTTEAIAALGDSVALYDQQVDNDQSVTVKDADRIREEQKFRYPTTYAGTKEVLRAYHWLLYVVLGEQHPITVAFVPLCWAPQICQNNGAPCHRCAFSQPVSTATGFSVSVHQDRLRGLVTPIGTTCTFPSRSHTGSANFLCDGVWCGPKIRTR
jgi:hypothetical protein